MERMLATASEYFTEESIRSTVVGQGSDHSFESELRAAGYDVRILPFVGGSIAAARDLRKLSKQLRVDVIHIHTEGDYLRTALASRWAVGRKGAVVRTVHNVFQARGLWRAKRFIQAQIADRLVYALIAPSPEVAENEKKLLRKARVIFNWVDDVFFEVRKRRQVAEEPSNNNFTALIVGNCSTIKQHELALRAVVDSDHKLVHLGSESHASPEELELLRILEDDGRLVDRGVKPPQDALLTASYFMMPSRHEGMPVALAEALVAGVPAIVNDTPGLRWARSMEGVSVVVTEQDAWSSAVRNWPGTRRGVGSGEVDFSAARGAKEYADVYRGAIASDSTFRKLFSKGGVNDNLA
ncbi:glycosyltransferase family 4 protein [Arthrobacter sp. KN11-1C]|uniref:glycosyltransferase family 4 protein n=1 Tax=Arthrobacter sp. KN11-1C TaxID=3445774 RepID=UPI003F9F8B8F